MLLERGYRVLGRVLVTLPAAVIEYANKSNVQERKGFTWLTIQSYSVTVEKTKWSHGLQSGSRR